MATLAIKLIAGSALTSTAILGGYGIHRYSKNQEETVKEYLSKEGQSELLNIKEFQEADKSTPDYKNWQEKINDSTILEEMKTFAPEIKDENDERVKINKLVDKCKEALNTKQSDSSNFESFLNNAKKFCTKKT